MTDQPRVSLLLPNYNNGAVLEHCLRRLSEHTSYPDVELIVADDGSTDDSVAILRRFGESARFLRSDDRVGVVQAKVIFDSGRVHTYGVNVVCPEGFHDRGTRITEPVGRREALGRLERPMEEDSEGGDEIAEVDAALACWAMMTASLVQELGGWDTETTASTGGGSGASTA